MTKQNFPTFPSDISKARYNKLIKTLSPSFNYESIERIFNGWTVKDWFGDEFHFTGMENKTTETKYMDYLLGHAEIIRDNKDRGLYEIGLDKFSFASVKKGYEFNRIFGFRKMFDLQVVFSSGTVLKYPIYWSEQLECWFQPGHYACFICKSEEQMLRIARMSVNEMCPYIGFCEAEPYRNGFSCFDGEMLMAAIGGKTVFHRG